jgi:hypothetical protein
MGGINSIPEAGVLAAAPTGKTNRAQLKKRREGEGLFLIL